MKLQDHENILMRTDRLDDDSVVVNFDVYDTEQREVTKDGGYVHIRQELDFFNVTVYDCDGDILSEVNVPFNFKELA
jgi:uncharacterized membrane protein affecting hemolysin expression